jgi:hypothetical protein
MHTITNTQYPYEWTMGKTQEQWTHEQIRIISYKKAVQGTLHYNKEIWQSVEQWGGSFNQFDPVLNQFLLHKTITAIPKESTGVKHWLWPTLHCIIRVDIFRFIEKKQATDKKQAILPVKSTSMRFCSYREALIAPKVSLKLRLPMFQNRR